jgi:hypothetical protein
MSRTNGAADPRRWHRPSAERDDLVDHRDHDLFTPLDPSQLPTGEEKPGGSLWTRHQHGQTVPQDPLRF